MDCMLHASTTSFQESSVWETCGDALKVVPASLLSSDQSFGVLANFGLALITIWVSVLLFLFSNEKDYLFEWDKAVILDRVIRLKQQFVALFLLFAPLFVWTTGNTLGKFIFLLIYGAGCSLIIRAFIRSYRWVRTIESKIGHSPDSYRNVFRQEYINRAMLSEKESIWSITWSKDRANMPDERFMLGLFIADIDILLHNGEYDIVARCLRSYELHLDARNTHDWTAFETMWTKLLAWHEHMQADLDEQDEESREEGHVLTNMILRRLLTAYTVCGMTQKSSFVYFRKLEAHLGEKPAQYCAALLNESLCSAVFENGDGNERRDMWEHYFPKDWKVTSEHMANPNMHISHIWFHRFIDWATERMNSIKDPIDQDLDDVSRELFPHVEPIMWAHILFLLYHIRRGTSVAVAVLSGGRSFGFHGRTSFRWGGDDKSAHQRHQDEQVKQEEETIELSRQVFGRFFTPEIIEQCKKELETSAKAAEKDRQTLQAYIVILDLLKGRAPGK